MSLVSFGRMRSAAMNSINSNVLPIAIDFGVSSLKVIQLASGTASAGASSPGATAATGSGGGESTSLIAAACLPTPEDFLTDAAKRFEFQFKALPRLIKSVGFKGKRAMCSIPAAQTFCKHMQFPRAENIDINELVRQAVANALECGPDALVYRHVQIAGATPVGAVTGMSTQGGPPPAGGSGGAKQEVICLAASRHFVGQIMAAIRESKLEPVGMHPECFATVRAFEQMNRRDGDKGVTTLYLDLAYGSTKVWISHGSELVFAKTIIVGGRDLDHAVSRSADCNLSAARAMRLNAAVLVAEPRRPIAAASAAPTPGGLAMLAAAMAKDGHTAPQPSQAVATEEDRRVQNLPPGFTTDVNTQAVSPVAPPDFDVREPLEMLTDEIAGCLRYHQSLFGGRRVDRVIFVGGESRHRGLCQHIARKVRVPAHVADPLARMARTGREPCHGIDFGAMQPGWTVAYGLGLCPTDL